MGFYDNTDNGMKTMTERCREYFAPEDFVVVMNVDTAPFTYIIQRPENVMINNPSAMTKELYYSKDPDVVIVQSGQTRMVPAYEADYFIKQLTDKIVLSNRAKIIDSGNNPTESAMDPGTQRKYIEAIFQGKKDFISEYNHQVDAQLNQNSLVEKELLNGPISQPAPTTGLQPAGQVPQAT